MHRLFARRGAVRRVAWGLPWWVAVTALLAMGPAPRAAGCPEPPGYTHATSVTDGVFRVTLATDRPRYAVGDTVHMLLSLENTGESDAVIPNPNSITPLHAFDVAPGDCATLAQPGCVEGLVFYYPRMVFWGGGPIVVPPGACLTYTLDWDGRRFSGSTPAPGDYAVFAGMQSGLAGLFLPPGGIRLTIGLVPREEVPVAGPTWGGVKVRYR